MHHFFFFYGFREIINGVLLFPICVLLYLSSLVLFVFSLFFYVLTFFSMRCENKIKWFVHMCLGFQGRFLVSFFFLMKCFALFFFVRSGFSNIRFYFPFGKKIKKNGLYIIFIGWRIFSLSFNGVLYFMIIVLLFFVKLFFIFHPLRKILIGLYIFLFDSEEVVNVGSYILIECLGIVSVTFRLFMCLFTLFYQHYSCVAVRG